MESYASMLVFAFAGALTPGPNPIMLITSGANHGIRRSVPLYFGICLGFPLLVAAIGIGLGALISQFPFSHHLLKIAGGSYLLYLAWHTATGSQPHTQYDVSDPVGFSQALTFQWVNPKAWMVATGAVSTFTQKGAVTESILMILSAFMISGFTSMAFWLTLGKKLDDYLNGVRARIFNALMGLLLALSVIPIIAVDLSFK